MKKLLKLVGLAVMVTSLFFVFGCGGDDDKKEDEKGNGLLTSEFANYYLSLGDFDLDGASNTIHFKNKSDHVVGIEIQKIYVSTNKTTTDAHLVWDFAADPAQVDAYWGFSAGTISGGKWSSGEVAVADPQPGETYITGFGSGAAYEQSAVYWIIVAKNLSDTVKGDDVTVELGGGEPYAAACSKTFAELFTK
jgi:hypothetical protein